MRRVEYLLSEGFDPAINELAGKVITSQLRREPREVRVHAAKGAGWLNSTHNPSSPRLYALG